MSISQVTLAGWRSLIYFAVSPLFLGFNLIYTPLLGRCQANVASDTIAVIEGFLAKLRFESEPMSVIYRIPLVPKIVAALSLSH